MGESTTWVDATKKRPCPICGHGDFCRISPDGQKVLCRRVESDMRRDTSLYPGWVHDLSEPVAAPPKKRKPRKTPASHWPKLNEQYQAQVSSERLAALSAKLSLSVGSLKAMGIGQRAPGEWSFPMCNHKQRLVGFRIRTDSGSKFSAVGSDGHGLFIPANTPTRAHTVWIVEGPTNCAAMLDIGFDKRMKYGGHAVLGRSACFCGTPYLLPWARGKNVVIVYDNDYKPGKALVNPGLSGAQKLAADLRYQGRPRSIVLISPPDGINDVRDWRIATECTLNANALDELAKEAQQP